MAPAAMIRLAAQRWIATAAFLLAVLAHLPAGLADERTADNFEAFLEPIRLHHNVPAVAAILMHGDRVTGIGAVGYRKSGEATPVSRDDRCISVRSENR